MQTITLGQITNIKTGKLDANAKIEGGKYPFFTCSKEISWIDIPSYDCECVLVAGNGDLNVKYYKGKFDAYQRTYIIESNGVEDLDMKYLYYFIEGYMETLRGQTIGGVIQYIKMNNLTDIQIPLPPLTTQRAIAAKLDKLQSLIDLKKQAITKTDDLAKSIFLEMFGDPTTNEKGREIRKLGEFTSYIGSGSTPLGGNSVYLSEGKIKFIRSQNVRMYKMNYKDISYISEKIHNSMKRTWLKNKDVLLNITGASIGRIAVYEEDDDIANVNQHVCIIRIKRGLNPYFVIYYYGYDGIQNRIISQQSGATRQAFNFQQIKFFDIYCPPLSLQQKFADIIIKLESAKEKNKQALAKLEDLYQSEMQRSFSL